MDILSEDARSERMKRIRSTNTKPEVKIRSGLHREGFRFRLHRRDLPGSPDIVLPKYKAAIQVRGCFWHQHSCRDGHSPKSRTAYWLPKLAGNVKRDRKNDRSLRRLGWRMMVVWECQIRSKKRLDHIISTLDRFIRGSHTRRKEKKVVRRTSP